MTLSRLRPGAGRPWAAASSSHPGEAVVDALGVAGHQSHQMRQPVDAQVERVEARADLPAQAAGAPKLDLDLLQIPEDPAR